MTAEGEVQLGFELRRADRLAEERLHVELGDRDVGARRGAGPTHVLAVQREQPDGRGEEARLVGTDDADGAGVHGDAGLRRGRAGRRLDRWRRGPAWRLGSDRGPHAVDEVVDELGPPRGPRGGSGGTRVGFGERVEELEGGHVTDLVGDEAQRGRVAQVAAGRDAGEEEVLADEQDEGGDVGGGVSHAGGDPLHQRDPRVGVVSRVPLAEVVEERADEQEVGAFDAAGQGLGARRGLHQVTVHGELVERVALRAAADGGPLGDETGHEVLLVEGLEDADRRLAGAEEGDERLACVAAPGRVEGRSPVGELLLGARARSARRCGRPRRRRAPASWARRRGPGRRG